MRYFDEEECAPPSTLRAPGGRDVDDRPTDVDPIRSPFPSFHSFGELSDAELREIVASQQTPLPVAQWTAPPSERRTFLVYERIVDTRRLRRGASPVRSGLSDFVAVAAFVGLVTGISGVAAALLAPEPPTPVRAAEGARIARPVP
ncbi:MAG: hypothetical protein JST00_46170 [Deltaproteobacteria bacterium]|nr:hypothetical protein [Deltaproteobacteria bacterium]